MKILLNFLLLLLPLTVGAQNIMKGVVKDARNNELLVGAVVSCKDLGATVLTDENGGFTIISTVVGRKAYHIISVDYLGYKSKSKALEIPADKSNETFFVEFELEIDPLTLQDVIVTANKVEERLQDVPIAATVLDRANLRKRTVADTEEAFSVIPNLVTDAYLPGRATFSLRGLSSDFENRGIENSVGLYIDDVFYSRSFNFNQSLMDIERVEVLRGPQGTLFGKNTIGGVLHVISEKPKMANFTALELNAGNFNYVRARIKGNMQLIKDKLAIRMIGAYRKRDGWMLERNVDVADQNGIAFFGGRLSMLYKPSEKMEVIVKGTFSRDDKADYTLDYRTPINGTDFIEVDSLITNSEDRITNQSEEETFFERRNRSVVARIDYQLNDILTLTSISSYTSSEGGFFRDQDVTPQPVAALGRFTNLSSVGQEIRVSTPREGRKWFFISGLFFQQEKIETGDSLIVREGYLPVLARITGDPIQEVPGYFEAAQVDAIINTSSLAAFSSTSYEVSDRVRLNAGLRYTIENKDLQFWQTCYCPLGFAPITTSIGTSEAPVTRKVNDGVLSGNLGVDFRTTDNMLIYINLARGFKGSGFNTIAVEGDNPEEEKIAKIFDPEFVDSYEFGVKLKSGNRSTFNAAAFVTNFKNKQETIVGNGGTFIANAESVQGQGIEAEHVGVWNKYLKTETAIGALNLSYTNFPYVNPTTGEESNLSGKKAIKAPNFTFKFSPEFHAPLGRELKLLVRMDYSYVGKSYPDIFNSENIARRGAGIINGRVGISSKNERFGIAIWGKNLTEALYFQHGWSYQWGDVVAVNPGRLIGVEFRANIY